MIDVVQQVGRTLGIVAAVAVILVTIGNQYPAVAPTVTTLLIGLCIVALGVGIALRVLNPL